MDEVFPRLSQIPEQLRAHLEKMIEWLVQANLQRVEGQPHIFQIFDADGKLRCLFKRFQDEDERSAKIEASVYLLDHPVDVHRSLSPSIYGFSGVLLTVFVRFTKGNEDMMGILVEYVEAVDNFEAYIHGIAVEEIHKISVVDIRFGNMDRHKGNLLIRLEENDMAHLVPIDHEMCFSNEVQNFNICSPYWLKLLKELEKDGAAFSSSCVNYVAQLDPDYDLEFLSQCGWEPGLHYAERFKVFATFLKKAVSQGLTAYHIGLVASFKCEEQFNLQEIVDSVQRDGDFFANVAIRIEERLRQYSENM